ncbi:M16 family metallopeptidase [Zhouia amylolytica]|uniref:Zn-dependent peptidase n=1 Tax=Zhouia amylolytica AD3 TaxID=1286632 RepID=W2UQY7_9FLAO|nr:insulinase family protein [Zhouia amylolytica]ETN96433.1 hypothetical protein P278_07010 [Zhouia amylolytica AD3]
MINKLMLPMLLLGAVLVHAQTGQGYDDTSKIPLDKSVTVGKLKNGLTYYIKRNTKPESKAQLRLVLKAGSLHEDDEQQGLAHFIEHMAFNGTNNFEKNSLIDYLQKMGVEFGADLNAHTSFHETVYKLSVPTTDEGLFDKSFLILRDWADGIVFDEEEIDAERGIILEEQRERNSVARRFYFNSLPTLTNNSRYAHRFPSGKKEVIQNFKYEDLERYYDNWYRPDLMAVIAVGDFDVAHVEKLIKKHFKTMNSAKDKSGQLEYPIPGHKDTKIVKLHDPEASKTNFSVYYKSKKSDLRSLNDLRYSIIEKLYWIMLKDRLKEKELDLNSPFLSTNAGIGSLLGDTDNYFLKASLKENKVKEGITSLFVENYRVKRNGFTKTELDRTKAYLLNYVKFVASEEDKIPSKHFVDLLTKHYSTGKPVPGKTYEYQFYKEVLPGITLEEVNELADKWIRDDNTVIVLTANKSTILPSNSWIKEEVDSISKAQLEPYHDSLADKQLMEELPSPGSILNTSFISSINTTIWELANGVRVIARPSNLQNGIVEMNSFRSGGSSVAEDSLFVSASNASSIVGNSGFNGISDIQIEKLNMGKIVSVTPRINFYDDLISGDCTYSNLETMLQMVYMYFTKPNKDEAVYNKVKSSLVASAKNNQNNANTVFYNTISEVMTQNHLRGKPLEYDKIKSDLSLETAFNFYKNRFASAKGFTFIFTGNFDLEKMKELIVVYLASLPVNENVSTEWRDIGLRRVKGRVKKIIYKGKEEKSKVNIRYTGVLNYSEEERYKIQTLGKILKLRLTEELREKMSGIYGVRASGFSTYVPYEWYRLNIEFSCSPSNINKLTDAVNKIIQDIKLNGVDEEDLNKIKKADINNHIEGMKFDAYWSYKFKDKIKDGKPLESILDFPDLVNSVTTEELQELAVKYFNSENYAEFVLLPEHYKK